MPEDSGPTSPVDSEGSRLAEAKRQLRRRLRSARRQLSLPEAQAAAEAVVAHWAAEPAVAGARSVALYAALPDELPTRPLFEHLRAHGRTVLLPRCGDAGRLAFARVDAWSELQPGRFGVLEPPSSAPSLPLGPDVPVLVPGIAFDRAGRRLGQGGGWYDRSFDAGDRGRLIGAGFALQVVATVPAGSGDRDVGAILTERGFTWVTRTA